MNWMIVLGIWMMVAFSVVLFVRGAQVREPGFERRADADDREAFALGRGRTLSLD